MVDFIKEKSTKESSRERAQEKELKRKSSRERAQEKVLKRKSSRERDQERRDERELGLFYVCLEVSLMASSQVSAAREIKSEEMKGSLGFSMSA